jgi:hypothetical protein
VGRDERGLVRAEGRAERAVEGAEVVPVHFDHAPAVGREVADDVLLEDRVVRPGELLVVPVEDADEVREGVLDREAARLGELALLLLAVPHRAEDLRHVRGPGGVRGGRTRRDPCRSAPRPPRNELRREREACGRGEPLPEVARPPVDPRDVALDVPLERRAAAPEPDEGEGAVEPPEVCEGRVGGGRRVPVADHDAVALGVERVLRVAGAETPEEELEIDGRHRAPRVPGRRERRHHENVAARRGPEPCEPGDLCVGELRRLEGPEDHARTPAPAAARRRSSMVPRSAS